MPDRLLGGIPNQDLFRFIINNRHLQNPKKLPFVRREHINLATILKILTKPLNSNEDFLVDGTLEVNLIHINVVHGGRSRKAWSSFGVKVENSKSIVQIKHKDNMCLAREIVVLKS